MSKQEMQSTFNKFMYDDKVQPFCFIRSNHGGFKRIVEFVVKLRTKKDYKYHVFPFISSNGSRLAVLNNLVSTFDKENGSEYLRETMEMTHSQMDLVIKNMSKLEYATSCEFTSNSGDKYYLELGMM